MSPSRRSSRLAVAKQTHTDEAAELSAAKVARIGKGSKGIGKGSKGKGNKIKFSGLPTTQKALSEINMVSVSVTVVPICVSGGIKVRHSSSSSVILKKDKKSGEVPAVSVARGHAADISENTVKLGKVVLSSNVGPGFFAFSGATVVMKPPTGKKTGGVILAGHKLVVPTSECDVEAAPSSNTGPVLVKPPTDLSNVSLPDGCAYISDTPGLKKNVSVAKALPAVLTPPEHIKKEAFSVATPAKVPPGSGSSLGEYTPPSQKSLSKSFSDISICSTPHGDITEKEAFSDATPAKVPSQGEHTPPPQSPQSPSQSVSDNSLCSISEMSEDY